ncbi:MAG TPA: fibronectin type III domain-containing protein [Pyrinomonadaceae bacterium]|nr:fibronectin type III domain-containing protein [Pyrinomonadaceae bacterium]
MSSKLASRFRVRKLVPTRVTVRAKERLARKLAIVLVLALLIGSDPSAVPAVVGLANQWRTQATAWTRDNVYRSRPFRKVATSIDHLEAAAVRTVSNVIEASIRRLKNRPPAPASQPRPFAFVPPPVLAAPSNLEVGTVSSSTINLSWTVPSGSVASYIVERSQNISGPFSVIATPTTTSYQDSGISSATSYLYRVRAVDSLGVSSPSSTLVAATAISFTDPTLTTNVSEIKKDHIYDLRQSVNSMRALAGLSAATWTDTNLTGVYIYRTHVQQLRDRLNEALTALSIPVTSFTDSTITVASTQIRKVHIEELRERSARGASTSAGPEYYGGNSSQARLDPTNETGGSGENPLSRNFNWSLPLVNLPGRSGLDLGLMLSYNSLVWTKYGSTISFDDDRGFPSAGFRLGFPVIQPQYYNAEVGKNAFLLILPDGSRTELRQVGATLLYEAGDSSHLLLDTNTMMVRDTSGMRMWYVWQGSDYQCTKIEDRNGNYITINYDSNGRLASVIDTLSRTINFNYGTNGLESITQSWTVNGSALTHYWARFYYGASNLTIQTNFTGLTVNGPQNSSSIRVLRQVKLSDDAHFDFDYTSWGQVRKITAYAKDEHTLNYRSYNLPVDSSGTAQTDCPRFTERRDWAENWNRSGSLGDSGLPSGSEQEVATGFDAPVSASWTLADSSSHSGVKAKITMPDDSYHLMYFEGAAGTSSGWKRGLPAVVETYGKSAPSQSVPNKQKAVVTTWDQDNTSVSYVLNPRSKETNISDFDGSGQVINQARTVITYQSVENTTCSLPQDVKEYQANATTVLRRTHVTYNLNEPYRSLRIIGLISERTLYEVDPSNGNETLSTKIGYSYDGTNSIVGNDSPVQHDTNFDSGVLSGRANMTSVTRYDVSTGSSASVTTSTLYNTAGSMVKLIDPVGHASEVSYADQFYANGVDADASRSFTTLAYPTSSEDGDDFTSRTRFNYDFGAVTWKQSPPPNATADSTTGPAQRIYYDSIGRLEKIASLVNGTYTRYVYSDAQNLITTYATVKDTEHEVLSKSALDGFGRVIGAAVDHPGSVLGYSGMLVLYDKMGRVSKQSTPAETSASGDPVTWTTDSGDDDADGWLYTEQTYDWNGRSIVTTNPDGTTKTASYNGCGCAGGAVVTLTDEGMNVGSNIKTRQQKVYADVLGRTARIDMLDWDGSGSGGTGRRVYSSVLNTYNARDQIIMTRRFDAVNGTVPSDPTDLSCPSGTCRKTELTYDGHGRLKTKHEPRQQADANISASSDHSTVVYNDDDTLQTMTDARGVVATFTYNARHLVTAITYVAPAVSSPGESISDSLRTRFGYDARGNRIWMNEGGQENEEGQRRVTYHYDESARMDSEERQFPGLSGSHTLSYEYYPGGALMKITDSHGSAINYGYDAIGRLNGVTASGTVVGGVTTYASGFEYRAWGALKEVSADPTHTTTFTYDRRLQPANFNIDGNVVNQNYDYHPDGSVKYVHNTTNNKFDRSYTYDQSSRLTIAASGGAARQDSVDTPMLETFAYNPWDETTQRTTESWLNDFADMASYTNGRRTGWGYDSEGRVTTIDDRHYSYDAAGRDVLLTGQRWHVNQYVSSSTSSVFDGDGQRIGETSNNSGSSLTTYYLRSSVLGGLVIEELDSGGQKQAGYAFTPQGELLARQVPSNGYVVLKQISPIGATHYEFSVGDTIISIHGRIELDPAGAGIPLTSHQFSHVGSHGEIPNGGTGTSDNRNGAIEFPAAGCTLDGVWVPCSMGFRGLASGTTRICPDNDCSPRRVDIDIRFKGGGTVHISGLVTDPDFNLNQTWTGIYGARAYREFFGGNKDNSSMKGGLAALAEWDRLLSRDLHPGRNYAGGQESTATLYQPDKVQDGINKAGSLLDSQRCKTFINRLLQQAAADIDRLLQTTEKYTALSDGFYPGLDAATALSMFQDQMNKGKVTTGWGSGRAANGNAVNYLSTDRANNSSVHVYDEYSNLSRDLRGLHVLHEALHQYRYFSDVTLANAGRAASGENTRRFESGQAGAEAASQDLNRVIRAQCAP